MRLYSIPAILAAYERGVRFGCGCGRVGVPESVSARIRCGDIKAAQLLVCSLHGEPIVAESASEAA